MGNPFCLEGSLVHVVKNSPNSDTRGMFSRIFDVGLLIPQTCFFNQVSQISYSKSLRKGTFRGMHVQSHPSLEAKAIRVLSGSIFDYIVNLDQSSVNFGKSISIEVSENDPFTIIIPPAHAHGIYTTSDNTIISYVMNVSYVPERDVSINYLDPKLGITLPGAISVISEKDESAPFLEDVLLKKRISTLE